MDKQQTTGLVLLTAMLIAYFMFFGEAPQAPPQNANGQDSTKQVSVVEQTPKQVAPVEIPDSVLQQQYGFFALGKKKATGQDLVLENDLLKITFNTNGGKVKEVLLRQFVDHNKEPLILVNEESLTLEEEWSTANGPIELNSLNYQGAVEGNRAVFTLSNGAQTLKRIYTLEEGKYTLSYNVEAFGLKSTWKGDKVRVNWVDQMRKVEKDMQTSRMRTTVNYYTTQESFDQLSETSSGSQFEKLEAPVKWVAMKQKFFNMGLITDNSFSSVEVGLDTPESDDTPLVKTGKASFEIPRKDLMAGNGNIRYYFGPNDLDICQEVAPGYDENVYLGWALFVPINRFLIMPFFQLLEGFITNYGIIILVLVFVVKMALFPLTYKSYLSMAKTRVLKPEMDALKEKYGDDTQKIQQETLKIQSQFGVSPLSGCIPMVAQMPILISLFTFFPNAIQLRQEAFLWADDLSTYDSIIDLPFAIPLYGAHVSLFTLLMTAVTLINTYYNSQMNSSAAMQGPMKYMGYFMPIMFLFVLNSYSSGLTYYYFLSTSITILQQLVSKRFINEEQIRAKLEENRKKNKNKKGGTFMSRMEKIMKEQEQARKAQEEQKNPRRAQSNGSTASKGAKNLKGKKRK